MQEYIGVRSWFDTSLYPSLKRDALMFNRVAIPDYDRLIPWLSKRTRIGEYYSREIEALFGAGFVFKPERKISNIKLWKNNEFKKFFDLELEESRKLSEFMLKELDSALEEVGDADPNAPVPLQYIERMIQEGLPRIARAAEYRARQISVQLQEEGRIQAFPILYSPFHSSEEPLATKTDVVRIVLNTIPIPDETTSWEQIVDYRLDAESQIKFLALRNWMSKLAKAKVAPNEVEEELADLINQYQEHMKLHKMKTKAGILETIIVGVAELAESTIKLKLGNIAKGAFSLKHNRIALLEGELKAPGREIAYVVKVNERFSRSAKSGQRA